MRRLILDRLHKRFVSLVEGYMKDADINQGDLALLVRIQRTHLNLLLSGKRPLSGHYIFQFLRAGIFKVNQIYDGDAKTIREEGFWETASEVENIAILARIAKLRKRGIDVDSLLDMIDPTKKDS